MTIIDDAATPCASLVRTPEGELIKCGCTRFEYRVGGRQAERRCSNIERCHNLARLDVTIDHAKTKWTRDTIREWWIKVYG